MGTEEYNEDKPVVERDEDCPMCGGSGPCYKCNPKGEV
jgi:hypothetical protein